MKVIYITLIREYNSKKKKIRIASETKNDNLFTINYLNGRSNIILDNIPLFIYLCKKETIRPNYIQIRRLKKISTTSFDRRLTHHVGGEYTRR